MRRAFGVGIAALLLVTALAGCSSGSTSEGFTRDTNDPADALVESKCSMCHTTERIYTADKTAEEWDTTMTRMKANGMVITDEDYDQILEYLSK